MIPRAKLQSPVTIINLYIQYIVLYFINGVVIAAQCTATIFRSIVLPRIWVLGREYVD